MFGFGHGPELIIILVIALIVLGPGKIPEIAQMVGKGLRELRQASSELQRTFDVNELMNPNQPQQPPAPVPEPPPVEAAPAPIASTQTIAPPALAEAAKPKRTRKRPGAASDASPAAETLTSSQGAKKGAEPLAATAVAETPIADPLAASSTEGSAQPGKPRRARRPAAAKGPSAVAASVVSEPVAADAGDAQAASASGASIVEGVAEVGAASHNGVEPNARGAARPRARRRASKPPVEAVSLDAPA